MSNYEQLKQQAEELMRQAEAARKAELGAAIADIKAKMKAFGITPEDLGAKTKTPRGRKPKSAKPGKTGKVGAKKAKPAKARKPVAAKYRNAETGETWSGRGKAPRWLATLEAAGRKRTEFAVG